MENPIGKYVLTNEGLIGIIMDIRPEGLTVMPLYKILSPADQATCDFILKNSIRAM